MNEAARSRRAYAGWMERRYGRGETTVEVLNGATLSSPPGQSVALIAPSGAGKSTLLHLAGLLERPDAGEVKVGGAATSTMSDDKRTALSRTEIGFVYQFHHSAAGILGARKFRPAADDRRPAARRRPRARARELLAYLGLAAARKPPPGRIVGRRTTARRYRARGRQWSSGAAGRRADRQSRPKDRRPRVCDSRRAGQGERPRRLRSPPITWTSPPEWIVASPSAMGR